jgi:tetratricopeptide (TPR) repeat protein
MGRRSRRSWASVAALVVLALGDDTLARAELPRASSERWDRVDTPRFTLFTNGGAPLARRIGLRLERLAEVLEQTTQGLEIRSRVPTYIYVFEDDASFEPYRTTFNGKPAQVDGFFVGSTDANYLALHAASMDRAFQAVQHEFMHFVLGNTVGDRLPTWLDEGLAEFYSTFRSAGKEADIGLVVDHHAAQLTRTREEPLSRMFAMGQNSPDYHVGERQGAFYAQSWAFVHFLRLGDPNARFAAFLTRLRKGADPIGAFTAVYGSNLDSLDREFSAYIRRPSIPYRKLTFERDFDAISTREERMSRAEVLVRLGDLLAHDRSRRAEDAEEHFEAALRLDPDNASALAGLGRLMERRGRAAAADSSFGRAIALGPRDAAPYLLAAEAWFERWHSSARSIEVQDSTPALLAAARKVLELGSATAPGHPELGAAFGKTFIADRNVPSEAVGALMDAAEALPARKDVVANLVILYCHSGNPSAARGLFRMRLKPRATSAEVRGFALAILQSELERATRLANEGHRDEAEAVLRRAALEAEHNEARRLAEERLARLAPH